MIISLVMLKSIYQYKFANHLILNFPNENKSTYRITPHTYTHQSASGSSFRSIFHIKNDGLMAHVHFDWRDIN